MSQAWSLREVGRTRLVRLIALAGIYVVAGKLGLLLAVVNPQATAVWPPSGIALAALLLLGRPAWPAILVGAFLVNVTTSGAIASSLGIAVGNTLEAVVGAGLVERLARGRRAFDRPRDIFAFALIALLVSAPIAATIGVASLTLGGALTRGDVASVWLTWWLGDAAGALVLAPIILLCAQPTPSALARRRREAAALAAVLAAVGVTVFGGALPSGIQDYPLAFLSVPPLAWAAFRFGPRETAIALGLLAALSALGTANSAGAYAGVTSNAGLLLAQAFMVTMSVTMLPVAALVTDWRRAEEERLVLLAREQLARAQAEERERVAQHVAVIARSLTESLDVATVGQRIVDAVLALFGARAAGLRLLAPDGRLLGIAFAGRMRDAFSPGHLLPAGARSVSGLAIVEGGPVWTADALHDARLRLADDVLRAMDAAGDGAMLAVPLRAKGETIGALSIADRPGRRFTGAEAERLQVFADHAAAAVQNARLFEEATRRRREAEAANRAKDRFLATLSHELRTPLNAMLGWARILKTPSLDDAQRAHGVDVIERNARLQAQLVSDLLDIARIAAGKLELERYPVDLAPVVQDAIEAVRSDVEAKGLLLESRLGAPVGEVLGDPRRLQQVVLNLLTNAVKFTPRGGRIAVELERAGGHARLAVRDSGEGIAADVLPTLFEPFQQADASTTRTHQGLGLGLAIVRQIVELHGGRVRAESGGPGRGATFVVDLPVLAASPWPLRAPGDGSEAAAPSWASVRMDGVQALVVDDQADARELLEMMLQQCGADVVLAGSASDALQLLAATRIDVVISDLAMPGVDGFGLIAAVRGAERQRGARAMPALAVTAYADSEASERALAAGFDACLTKPVDPEAFVRLVARMAGG
ncbi:MAG TPA: MASE1 domain-containing protein [Candidatus Tectomicrobia bacterium]|nr:MASE1 domain-containing protein [Candidatus Tectomicrobia bacterium]